MTFQDYRFLVLSDLYRITANTKTYTLLKYLFMGGSYKYVFWMRTCSYLKSSGSDIYMYIFFPIARIILNHYTYKFGISISSNTKIGSGFYVGHFGGIIVSDRTIIGKNLNISQGVTIGQANRGQNKGYPTLGDNIYLGPGAKIVGAVHIGNNVCIGANCVVTKDIPDNSVVVGVPGKVISQEGSKSYVNRTDYADRIR